MTSMRIIVFILLALTIVGTASAQQLTIAAAADLQFAFQDLTTTFETQSGVHVRVIYGSSGNFAPQIENGAPFDLFFSADIAYPQKLLADGFAEGVPYRYANGKLVLWVPNESQLDLARGLTALADASVKKVAIANPQHAPYGRAAVAAMKSTGVYDKVQNKLVMGENISQTAQFLQTGSADIGFVALSLALSPNMKQHGRYIEVPQNLYPPIEQAGIVVRSSHSKADAARFIEFMKTPAAQQTLSKYGFTLPK